MSSFIKSNAVAKDTHCANIYNRFIANTCDFIQHCEEIGEVLSIKLPTGCYTNFRDALFHFRRLVKSSEENESARHSFAIEEHANRARTDAIVCILDCCTFVLDILSHEEFELSEDTLKQLAIVKKDVCNSVMYLRLSGIMLDQTNILRISDGEFEQLLVVFFNFINEYIGDEMFRKALEQL